MRRYKEKIYLFFNLFSIEILMFIIFFYNRKMDMIYVNDEFVSYLFEGMYLSLTIFITEEMIFREGFFIILKNKMKYYNVIQALIFALCHRYFIQKIYTFISGIFLGNVKDRKGNIWLCIYLHMLFNITGIYLKDFYLGFIDSIIKMLNMENNLLFMTIVFIIMFILHTAGFIWSLKKIGKGFYKLF